VEVKVNVAWIPSICVLERLVVTSGILPPQVYDMNGDCSEQNREFHRYQPIVNLADMFTNQ